MTERIVDYVTILSPADRRRHRHITLRGKVIEFMVQYETRIDSSWRPVMRYDSAHGVAHRHRFYPHRKARKFSLDVENFNEALTFAEADINSNWRKYKQSYLREVGA